MDIQGNDNEGNVWTFKCSIRKKGHPKLLSKDWLAFVACKSLKGGDKLTFYLVKKKSSTATHVYRVLDAKQIKMYNILG